MNLLIIDDEQITRNGLMKFIDWKKLGFNAIKAAESGLVALSLCKNFKPDLILSDIRMREMDGVEVCKKIREIYENIEIIFISGYSDKEYLMGAIELNVVHYVEKPVNIKQLEDAVKKAIVRIEKNSLHFKYNESTTKQSVDEINFSSTIFTINKYIEDNYMNTNLCIKMIADSVFLTPTYLSNLYKRKTGKTIGDYITHVRIEKAKELIKDKSLKLYDVCEMVGYTDTVYFTKIFKKQTGITPSKYRETKNE